MKDISFTIGLKCFFCDCILEGDSEKDFSSGDMLRCQHCHELNDYDVLIDIAAKKGKEIIADHAQQEIEKILKKAFKK